MSVAAGVKYLFYGRLNRLFERLDYLAGYLRLISLPLESVMQQPHNMNRIAEAKPATAINQHDLSTSWLP